MSQHVSMGQWYVTLNECCPSGLAQHVGCTNEQQWQAMMHQYAVGRGWRQMGLWLLG